MSSISSRASAALVSDSSEPGCAPSRFASPMLLVSHTSHVTGRTFRCSGTCAHSPSNPVFVTCCAAAFPVNLSAPPLVAAKSRSICGPNSYASSRTVNLLGSWLKTFLVSVMEASSGCVVISRRKVMSSGRSIAILRYRKDSVAGIESSGWPTPTTRYTIDSPSMRKWPAYARYQDIVGRTTPRLWEWMMCFPDGWTDSSNWATASLLISRKRSVE